MTNDIHLFIGGKEVEFNQTPQILYNYALKDIQNPTIVRNSFSKSLDIPFTPTNDDIFSHFWNLQRQQSTDISFNPIKKVPFELYFSGALIEKGYAKLDKVKQANHTGTYSITLYGGIGTFFYNLAYDEGATGDSKKNMASLQYLTDYEDEPDLNFRINKDEVYDAWQAINGFGVYDERYDVINFAPCYNGIPSDFDADKVLINYSGRTNDVFLSAVTSDGVRYTPYLNNAANTAGYALAEASSEMTEWETFDLRSYLQRPVLNVKRALQACFHPANNGGWQVKLDSDFFNNNNPYWTDAWMTLPMLRDLEIAQGESETITGATITYSGTTGTYPMTAGSTMNLFKVNTPTPTTLSRLTNARITIQPKFTPSGSAGTSTLYASKSMYIDTGLHLLDANRWVRWFYGDNGVIIQLEALAGNAIVAVSDAYLLGGFDKNTGDDTSLWKKFQGGGTYKTHFVQGKWVQSGGAFYFTSMNGNRNAITFNLNTDADYNTLRLRVMFPETYYARFSPWGTRSVYDNPVTQNVDCELFTNTYFNISGDYTFSGARNYGTVKGKYSFDVVDMELEMVDYDSLFSNTYIPKNKLLATSFTPADFLLAYAKMFGLYFYIDPAEPADDTSKYPSGVVHILTRKNFYDDKHIDITNKIDRSQNMDIQPTTIQKKWVEFNQEQNDSEVASSYEESYGHQYGRQLINTNYEFNADTLKAYDSTVFKGGVMVTEKSKYYYQPIQGVPCYVWNGLTYSLFNGSDNYEVPVEVTRLSVKNNLNVLGFDGYDAFAKLQCHTAENSPADGSGVLLFYKGYYDVSGRTEYWITDDVQDMVYLNDGTPCWIMTNCTHNGAGSEIAKKMTLLPIFTRDLINFGWLEGNIVNSFNFGHPQVTYVPNTYTTDGDSIYDKCWKSYINDLYDENTRQVSCYVRFPQVPHPSYLRHWWHFDGAIWALNEIKDWNPLEDKPTLATFIKVQDVENYSNETITKEGFKSLVLDTYSIGASGGTISGQIYLQNGGNWFTSDSQGIISGKDESGVTYYYTGKVTPYTGSGTLSDIQVSIPENPTSGRMEWTIVIEDDYDNQMRAVVSQEAPVPEAGTIQWNSDTINVGSGNTSTYKGYTATNMDLESIYAYSDADWVSCTANTGNSRVTVMVQANPTPQNRSTKVYVYGFDLNGRSRKDEAILTQLAGAETPTIAVDKGSIEWLYMQNSSTTQSWFTVTGYAGPYTIVTDDEAFATNPTGGTNVTRITGISYDQNYTYEDKTARAIITDGNTTLSVDMVRKAVPHTRPVMTAMLLPSTGATRSFQIAFNGFTVYFDNVPDWINLRDGQGNTYNNREWIWPDFGDRFIFMDVDINQTGADRTANIMLKNVLNDAGIYSDGPGYQPIQITQPSVVVSAIDVSKTGLTWSYTQVGSPYSDIFTVSGTAQNPYTITSDNPVFSTNPTGGTGIMNVSAATASQNLTYEDKVGTLTVTDGITTKEIQCIQYAVPHIEPQYTALNMPYSGRSIEFNIEAKGGYVVYFWGKPDWIIITDNSGNTYDNNDIIDSLDAAKYTFYFNATANYRGQRIAYIQLRNAVYEPGQGTYEDGPTYFPIQITQASGSLTSSLQWFDGHQFSINSGNTSIVELFTCVGIDPAEVRAYAEDEWATCTVDSSNTEVTITVQMNPLNTSRSTNVVINAYDYAGNYVSDIATLTQSRGVDTIMVKRSNGQTLTGLTWLYNQGGNYPIYSTAINVTGTAGEYQIITVDDEHFTTEPSTGTGVTTGIFIHPLDVNYTYDDKESILRVTDGHTIKEYPINHMGIPHTHPTFENVNVSQSGATFQFEILGNGYVVYFEGLTSAAVLVDPKIVVRDQNNNRINNGDFLYPEDYEGKTFTITFSNRLTGSETYNVYLKNRIIDASTSEEGPRYYLMTFHQDGQNS